MNESEEDIRNNKIKKFRSIEFTCLIIWIGGILLNDFIDIPDSGIKAGLLVIACIAAIAWLVIRIKRFNIERNIK